MRATMSLWLSLALVACGTSPGPSAQSGASTEIEDRAAGDEASLGDKPGASPVDEHAKPRVEPDERAKSTTNAKGRADPLPAESSKAGPPPPLPKGSTVLHVGDSMADALGKDLRRELIARGLKAPVKYQEATYIPQWAGHTMGFDGLIARHDPDLVIITLGGNETAMPDPTERIEPIKRLVKKVGDRPCLWVAAPLWPDAPNTGILDVIRENCAPCLYVDTNTLVKPRMEVLGDGIHPTLKERKRWAKFMIRFLRHNRDPAGARLWDFKVPLAAPPADSVDWE